MSVLSTSTPPRVDVLRNQPLCFARRRSKSEPERKMISDAVTENVADVVETTPSGLHALHVRASFFFATGCVTLNAYLHVLRL